MEAAREASDAAALRQEVLSLKLLCNAARAEAAVADGKAAELKELVFKERSEQDKLACSLQEQLDLLRRQLVQQSEDLQVLAQKGAAAAAGLEERRQRELEMQWRQDQGFAEAAEQRRKAEERREEEERRLEERLRDAEGKRREEAAEGRQSAAELRGRLEVLEQRLGAAQQAAQEKAEALRLIQGQVAALDAFQGTVETQLSETSGQLGRQERSSEEQRQALLALESNLSQLGEKQGARQRQLEQDLTGLAAAQGETRSQLEQLEQRAKVETEKRSQESAGWKLELKALQESLASEEQARKQGLQEQSQMLQKVQGELKLALQGACDKLQARHSSELSALQKEVAADSAAKNKRLEDKVGVLQEQLQTQRSEQEKEAAQQLQRVQDITATLGSTSSEVKRQKEQLTELKQQQSQSAVDLQKLHATAEGLQKDMAQEASSLKSLWEDVQKLQTRSEEQKADTIQIRAEQGTAAQRQRSLESWSKSCDAKVSHLGSQLLEARADLERAVQTLEMELREQNLRGDAARQQAAEQFATLRREAQAAQAQQAAAQAAVKEEAAAQCGSLEKSLEVLRQSWDAQRSAEQAHQGQVEQRLGQGLERLARLESQEAAMEAHHKEEIVAFEAEVSATRSEQGRLAERLSQALERLAGLEAVEKQQAEEHRRQEEQLGARLAEKGYQQEQLCRQLEHQEQQQRQLQADLQSVLQRLEALAKVVCREEQELQQLLQRQLDTEREQQQIHDRQQAYELQQDKTQENCRNLETAMEQVQASARAAEARKWERLEERLGAEAGRQAQLSEKVARLEAKEPLVEDLHARISSLASAEKCEQQEALIRQIQASLESDRRGDRDDRDALAALRSRLEDLVQQSQAQQQAAEETSRAVSRLSKDSELQAENQGTLSQRLDQLRTSALSVVQSCQEEIAESRSALKALQVDFAGVRAQQKELQECTRELEQVEAEHYRELRASGGRAATRLEELDARVGACASEQRLEEVGRARAGDKAELEGQLAVSGQRLEGLERRLEAHVNKDILEPVRGDLEQLQSRLGLCERQALNAGEVRKLLDAELAGAQAALRERLCTLERMPELEKQLVEQQGCVEVLQGQRKELEKSLQLLEAGLRQCGEEVAEVSTRGDRLGQQLVEEQHQREQSSAEMVCRVSEAEAALSRQLEQQQATHRQLEAELGALSQRTGARQEEQQRKLLEAQQRIEGLQSLSLLTDQLAAQGGELEGRLSSEKELRELKEQALKEQLESERAARELQRRELSAFLQQQRRGAERLTVLERSVMAVEELARREIEARVRESRRIWDVLDNTFEADEQAEYQEEERPGHPGQALAGLLRLGNRELSRKDSF
ncbi:unnamed protein product [Effrenium voratum]|uniref:Uncharacterized protein n=1 Tax=Effrenium voratum TaxID=2562239 RepID=A0AA36J6L6_9DINO|nr:unnamed protein product [Effrenium voratum]